MTDETQANEEPSSEDENDPMRPVKMAGGILVSYRYYVLAILTLIYVVNWIDRYVFAILIEDIRADLGFSYTALGFLTGTAFALFYATLGMPIARLADRTKRKNIVAWCLGIFSVMTAACGAVQNFWQFALVRVGVGIGEAGTSPPSHSMIADLFPPKKRATAMAIFAAGLNIGIFIAFFFGGWIAEAWGWRVTFLLAGVPGLFLVLVIALFFREPPRGHADGLKVDVDDAPSIMEVFKHLWGLKTFRHLSIAAALNSFVGYGALNWVPAYLIQSHGMSVGEVGTSLAIIVGIFGGVGTFAGGMLVDRMSKGDARWNVWVPAVAVLVGTPFGIAFYLSDYATIGLALWILPVMASAIYLGPALSVTQGLASLKMRALASAVLLFIVNLIGLGLGPLVVGILADLFQESLGSDALRYALVCGSIVNLWAIFHFLMAGRTVREDLAAVAEAEGRAEA